eukprot:gnl/TRDRNA2_/TRDRNA2_81283_c0_seq1.p1 gnl/TRDRNA2_/TRDRNA2_81283_c0~~gnl/TRDRNA2_/TRDRNA2_81283_c0_seq1.p1  ORF type:complete len:139 (-),score=14.39 gnl/TRDRNA2_/TRDRNA2_81283_c0_seq1:53-469(-)
MGSEPRLHKLKPSTTVPGPGAYEVVKKDPDGSCYSVAGRPQDNFKTGTPGPAAYKPSAETACAALGYKNSPKYTWGVSPQRENLAKSKTPGPGAYKDMSALGGNCAMKSPPKYSIGGSRSSPALTAGNSIGLQCSSFG